MKNTNSTAENKMGTMRVNKLLLTMSIPIVISMLIQAFYNIVDSVFVAKLSEDALTALSLAFPIQNLMIAVSVGTGVGVNALLSRNLGEKKYKQANKAALNGIFVIFISYLAFAIFGLFFANNYFVAQFEFPEENLQIIKYGTTYLSICTIFSFGIFMEIMFERILQSTGKTIYTMISQGTGAIINIILDPILIFGLLGFPKLGVAGAAWATVIGQIIAMGLSIFFNLKNNPEIDFNLKGFKPDFDTIKNIYVVGFPSILMASLGSVMVYFLNKILLVYSTTAAAILGIYFKLQSFVFMPVFGINNGMVPIIAYNYGARRKKRILDTIKLSTMYATIIMIIGLLIFQIAPTQLFKIFDASEEMFELGVPALRIISLNFIFAGVSIILSSVYQAFGNGVFSLALSFFRQIIFILPLAYIFSKTMGINAIWASIPIAEVAALIFNFFLFKHLYDKKIKPITLENEDEDEDDVLKAASL